MITIFLFACDSPQLQEGDPNTMAVVGDVGISSQRLERAFHKLYKNPSEKTTKNQRKTLDRLIDIEVLLLEAR